MKNMSETMECAVSAILNVLADVLIFQTEQGTKRCILPFVSECSFPIEFMNKDIE